MAVAVTETVPVRWSVALSAGVFAVMGAGITLPGALLPRLLDEFQVTLLQAGSMLAFQPVAYLLAVLAAGRVLSRFGLPTVLAGGVLAFGLGLAGFGAADGWLAGAAMLFVSGIGFGLMEVGANTLLVLVGGARSSNLLNFAHLFFGVGSFIAPALATRAVQAGVSWRLPFFVAAGAAALVAAGWRTVPAPAQRSAAAEAEADPVGAPQRMVFLLAALLGLYVGVETGIGAWLTKYLVSVHHSTLADAGNVLSLYWLALTVGRLLLSLSAHRVSEPLLILALSLLSTVGVAAALLLTGSERGAAAGFAIAGFGFSGIFPGVIALAGRIGPRDTGRVMSVVVTGAAIGGIVVPWVMSAIADAAGMTAGMGFYLAMCALMTALAAAARRSPIADR
jgi:fucose permease